MGNYASVGDSYTKSDSDVRYPLKTALDVAIENSNSVSLTMVNGRLYDTDTMNEIGNTVKERTKFYWENNKYNTSFPWHETSNSFTLPGCGCEIFHK